MTEQSLAALAGHDAWARSQVDRLLDAYRHEGITGLRQATAEFLAHVTEDQGADLLAEAVLTIAERTGTAGNAGRRAWETFDTDEASAEAQQIDRGGNR